MPLAACGPCQRTYVVGEQNPEERFCPQCGAPLREMSREETQEYLRQLADRAAPTQRPSTELNARSS
jgi:transcription initiation factor IIE alpha subunit